MKTNPMLMKNKINMINLKYFLDEENLPNISQKIVFWALTVLSSEYSPWS